MANENPEQPRKQVTVQKIFLQDASLEVPKAPDIFTLKWEPKVDVQLNNSVAQVSDGVHQVTLIITVTATLEDKTAYLAEVHQTGIFTVVGFDDRERHAVLGAYCPNLLFSFARESVADLIQRAGFPQFLLQPVNFDALYQQHIEQAAAAQTQGATAPH